MTRRSQGVQEPQGSPESPRPDRFWWERCDAWTPCARLREVVGRIPPGAVETVIATAFVALDVWHAVRPDAAPVFLSAALIVAIAFTPRLPRIMTVLFLVTFVTYVVTTVHFQMLMFLPMLLIELLASRGRFVLTAVVVPVIAVFTFYDVSDAEGFVVEPTAIIVWIVVTTLALVTGRVRWGIRAQRTQLTREREVDLRSQRLAIASDLHDSVAKSLTSIVMRAEALALNPSTDPGTAGELRKISEAGRRSMEELRAMLSLLSQSDRARVQRRVTTPGLMETLTAITVELEGAGLDVDSTVRGVETLDHDFSSEALQMANKILVEAATNAAKYTPRHGVVSLRAERRDGGPGAGGAGEVVITMTNPIDRGVKKRYMTSGLGLPAMTSRAKTVGATVTTSQHKGQWTTTLRLPGVTNPTP